MEKRACKRYNRRSSIICGFLSSSPKETYKAQMINYSKDGIYVESDFVFNIGTNILYRMESCSTSNSDSNSDPETLDGFRTISLAEVKWWKKIRDKIGPKYGLGLTYLKYY